jgi:hypothetical protein
MNGLFITFEGDVPSDEVLTNLLYPLSLSVKDMKACILDNQEIFALAIQGFMLKEELKRNVSNSSKKRNSGKIRITVPKEEDSTNSHTILAEIEGIKIALETLKNNFPKTFGKNDLGLSSAIMSAFFNGRNSEEISNSQKFKELLAALTVIGKAEMRFIDFAIESFRPSFLIPRSTIDTIKNTYITLKEYYE